MEVQKEGWLFKQSKFLKRLRKRYIILTKDFICSFKSQYYPGEKPTEILYFTNFTELTSVEDLRKIRQVEREIGLNDLHLFKIRYINRNIVFVTVDRDEKNDWMKHISKQMIKQTVLLND
ncbi:conserved protein, unknown function [Hepatocystis sp. ex Piliocolobus tephrosceles]|nr:conserved protein, unknown function [Hepatocystis sp. ex Piliocolobus tephrosceles]